MNTVAAAPCRVCAGSSRFVFSQRMLGNEIRYFDCPACGYMQTEAPYWLDKAYTEAINEGDTGLLMRNQQNVGRVIMTLLAFGKLRGTVIDHAGGYGVLVRMLRDAGIDARWRDKYCQNLLAKGFEAQGTGFDLLTAFEVIEHVVDPTAELSSMLADAPVVLLSTELITSHEPPPSDWWYLGLDHGQHIGFFRERTLAAIAAKLGCEYRSDGTSLHVFARDRIPATYDFLIKRSQSWRFVTRLARLRSKTVPDHQWITTQRKTSSS